MLLLARPLLPALSERVDPINCKEVRKKGRMKADSELNKSGLGPKTHLFSGSLRTKNYIKSTVAALSLNECPLALLSKRQLAPFFGRVIVASVSEIFPFVERFRASVICYGGSAFKNNISHINNIISSC